MPRGDGELHITFVDVGHGNCTMIALPDGKLVMVDLGSGRWPRDRDEWVHTAHIRNEIFDNNNFLYTDLHTYRRQVMGIDDVTYARHPNQALVDQTARDNMMKIEALFISHPDRDHYDKLVRLFWELDPALRPTRFETIYHVMAIGDHTQNGVNNWIYNNVNKGAVTALQYNNPVGNAPLPILIGTNMQQGSHQPCNVYVLAADYQHPGHAHRSADDRRNEASMVIKIVFGGDSILLPGDATIDTEQFLRTKYQGTTWLQSDYLVVGHHGSETSSSQAFINRVQASAVIISSKEDSYQVPKKHVFDYCQPHANPYNHHTIGYYQNTPHSPWKVKTDYEDEIRMTAFEGSISYSMDGR